MMDTQELAQCIEDTRITYPETDIGVRIQGNAFTLEFEDSVDPESFCETVATPEDPWNAFGVTHKLADERTDEDGTVVASEYWKLSGVLSHVDDGETVDASKITLEVTSEWARVYVKDGCCERRAAEFIRTIDDEYGIEVSFGHD